MKKIMLLSMCVILAQGVKANEVPEASSGFQIPVDFVDSKSGFGFKDKGWFTDSSGAYVNAYPACGTTVYHPGVDLNHKAGGDHEKVHKLVFRAAANGVIRSIVTTGWTPMVIEHLWQGKTWYSLYGHGDIDANLKEGMKVKKGQVLGIVGNNGTGGAHLHFEIRKSAPSHPDPTNAAYFCANTSKSIVSAAYENPIGFVITHGAYQAYATAANIAWTPATAECQNAIRWINATTKQEIANRSYQSVDGYSLCLQYDVPGQCTVD